MEPTPRAAAWAAWAGWAAVPRDLLERRRVRLTVHELADARSLSELRRGDWARLPAQQLGLYTPQQLRHLIRLESALGRPPTTPPDRWRRRDQDAYWRVQEFLQNVRLERPALSSDLSSPGRGAPPPARAHGGWDGAARGWAAGAVVLAVLVLLVRALERFLHKKLFKGRRRRSEEWPTPNVLATSHRYGNGIGPPPGLDDSDAFPPDRDASGNDLPPPYSECANNDDVPMETIDPNKPTGVEEPPPPYSACYFTNPKDGIPTVHFYNRRNNPDGGGPSTENDASTSNLRQDRISDVGCESNNVDINVTQETTNANSDISNTEVSSQEVWIRNPEEHRDHVVDIVPDAAPQGRVFAV